MSDLSLLVDASPLLAAGGGLWWARAKRPAVYWSLVQMPATWARFTVTYRSTMDACGLTVRPSRLRMLLARAARREVQPVPPRVLLVTPTTTGLRVRLRLPAGLEPADVAAASGRLRHAWGVHAVNVVETKPGVVELRMTGYDVLRRVRMPRRARSGPMVVPVAVREDGTPFVRDYLKVPHALTLGANQSGKSMYHRNLIKKLASQRVALVGIDCKRGVEQSAASPRLSALATDPTQALELLDALVEEMERRYDLLKEAQGIAWDTAPGEITADIWGLAEDERPVPIVVFIDEVAELFLAWTRKDEERRDRIVTQLIRLAQLARAVGIFLEVCGQRFGSELGKGATMLRAQLTGRVVHRVADKQTAEMGLGDLSPEAVPAATSIPPDRPGTAVAADASGGWSRIRTPLTSLADMATACRLHAHLVPDVPALAPFRPQVPAEPATATPVRLIKPVPAAE
ncbi:FtsK/SpoIIIE domain-containing protein [Streptomyces alkaliterrae]|uniref:Plasmid transfer protein n=1 Tax=Streptomyces alkaliterrae TaxID=2213162 RepID=A0A5P0Z024_9ACTN|nr:FtsK/SpoIIIE domain-containing protein [Streptomyces alkaliterrae]MBB1256563.1 plasmid transfer protein [Streptomyces alkaliterrae]MBB1262092.1 plasmid transfer protein [Streptomyces alkaliterrae]MQS04639.1 plasmid transfer protein [Streptomyces alkaliterrae]